MAIATLLISIVNALAVVAALLYLGSQTRTAARAAGGAALVNAIAQLDAVVALFVDRPDLRPYFQGGRTLEEDAAESVRERVLAVAELYADALSMSIAVWDVMGVNRRTRLHYSNMKTSTRDMLSRSPSLRRIVEVNRDWWPELESLLDPSSPEQESRIARMLKALRFHA